MKKLIYTSSAWTGFFFLAATLILCSCHKDEYSPISATKQQRGILLTFSSESNKKPLDDNRFVAGITVFGNESQAQLPCTVKKINGKPYLFFVADLPDAKNMKFTGDQKKATAMTEITLKVNKEKATLKCYFQYQDASKPPMPTASNTSIILESITLDRKTIKRGNKTVIDWNLVFPLQMDAKGKLH